MTSSKIVSIVISFTSIIYYSCMTPQTRLNSYIIYIDHSASILLLVYDSPKNNLHSYIDYNYHLLFVYDSPQNSLHSYIDYNYHLLFVYVSPQNNLHSYIIYIDHSAIIHCLCMIAPTIYHFCINLLFILELP
jgi:hypothetical protein